MNSDNDKIKWLLREALQLCAQLNKEAGKTDTCPKCGENIGEHPAISRIDNETCICSACGNAEAMQEVLQEDDNPQRFRSQVVITPQAADEFPQDFIASCLHRHTRKDWGDLDEEDKKANDRAVLTGGRVLSSYDLRGDKLWIITEADRSITTILCPSEY